ncbi:hypothetical protein O6270_23930, partial [Salmonella enterica subsp. enterica]
FTEATWCREHGFHVAAYNQDWDGVDRCVRDEQFFNGRLCSTGLAACIMGYRVSHKPSPAPVILYISKILTGGYIGLDQIQQELANILLQSED